MLRHVQPLRLLLGVFLASHVTACVSPTVKYVTNSADYSNGYIKFHLTGSYILLSMAQSSGQGTTPDAMSATSLPPSNVGVAVVPKEQKHALYAIVPHSQWFGTVRTLLSATYYGNTRLIKELGTEVEDNRAQAIQAMGAVAKAAIAGFKEEEEKGPESINVPVVIDPDTALADQWSILPNNPRWIYKLQFGANEIDAIPSKTFFSEFSEDGWRNTTSVFPVSACKSAILNLKFIDVKLIGQLIGKDSLSAVQLELRRQFPQDPDKDKEDDKAYERRLESLVWEQTKAKVLPQITSPHAKPAQDKLDRGDITFSLQLASPDHIRTVRMPDKGSVVPHTICGADTKTTGSNGSAPYDLVGEIMKQVQSIRDAQK